MKAYKPGDIYKTNPILRRATGQDKTYFDKFLEVAGTVKSGVENIFNNRIADNIQRLEEEKEFDKINAKAQLTHLSQFGNIQKDIETKYKNDVKAWARDYAREEVNDDFIRKQGMNMSPEDLNKVVKQPTAAYGDYLKNREEELVNSYNAILSDLDSLGVPYRDLDASKKFIDESYENIFNNMADDNRFNLIGGIGSFLRGNGFNTTDYNELSKQYENNAFQAKLSDIEDVNNRFKALYAMSPALAAQFEKTVESIDYKVMGETKLITEDLPDGAGTLVTYIQNYTDKNGNPRMVQKQEVITNPIEKEVFNQKGKTFEAQKSYMEFLTPEGQKIFLKNLTEPTLTIHDVYLNVPDEHRMSYDEAIAKGIYENNLGVIVGSFDDIMEQKFYRKNALGQSVPIESLQAYIDGTGDKPKGFYDTPYEFAQSFIPNLNIQDFNRIVYPDSVSTIQTTGNSFVVDASGMDENIVAENINQLKEGLNLSDAKIQSMQNDLESGIAVKGVTAEGEYYGDNSLVYNVNELLNAAPEFTDTISKEPALANAKKIMLGYNLKTDELIMKPASNVMTSGDDENDILPPPEPTDKGPIRGTGLIEEWAGVSGFDISNVPVLSSELIFGKKIGDDITDIVAFIPGYLGGKFIIKSGGNFIKGVSNKLDSIQKAVANKISEAVGRERVKGGLDVASKIPEGQRSIPLSDLGLNAGEILLGKTKLGGLVRLVVGGKAAETAMPDNLEGGTISQLMGEGSASRLGAPVFDETAAGKSLLSPDEDEKKKVINMSNDVFEPKKVGKDVTFKAIDLVADSSEAAQFLREIANVESKFGTDNNTFKRKDSSGIFQVEDKAFNEVQRRLNPNEDVGASVRAYNEYLKENVGIDLTKVSYQDLDSPIYSAAFARAYLKIFPEAIPSDVEGRGAYWKKYYNTEKGKGTVARYIKEN